MRLKNTLIISTFLLFTNPLFAAFDLQVTEIWPGNEPGENLTEDWFEIVNNGDTAWVNGVDAPLYYDDTPPNVSNADPITGISSIEPGEAVVVLVTDDFGDISTGALADFINVWGSIFDTTGLKVGVADGSGLGQGGDGVTLFLGDSTTTGVQIDLESYPDANANGGQSYDVMTAAFSLASATVVQNDESQAAVGTPGNLDLLPVIGGIPEITLLGDDPLIVTLGSTFTEPGATAFDVEDGDISAAIVVTGDNVDTATLGDYELVYDVSDSDGNYAATQQRDVVVTYAELVPVAPAPANPDLFSHVATLPDLPGSEITAYNAKTRQAYVTSGDGVQIVDLKMISSPVLTDLIDPAASPFDLNSSAVTSVDTCGYLVAFAVPNEPQTDNGTVVFTNARGHKIRKVTVGALPDMLTFTKDCSKVLVANEGEPDGNVDPEATISIIDVQTGQVKTADFTRFNGIENALMARGVRLFPGIPASKDFEPEYIALKDNGRFAYIALQEANTIALLDVNRAKIVQLFPLGLKDHSIQGNELDASDRDSVINIRNWPLQGMYMPDAIDLFNTGSGNFIITANEGDARDADERVNSLTLDPAAFPNAAELQNDLNMGRIQVSSIDGDDDGDGDFDRLQSYGARSFSILDRRGNQVFDSGSQIEAIVATYGRDNADDGRSDNKGPEPEGVETGKIDGTSYAFIGLERTSQVLVYDVSTPWSPVFVQLLSNADDVSPEGLKFISKKDSPNQCPALLVSNEVSNTLSIYQLTACIP